MDRADMTAPMPETMSPREKVARAIKDTIRDDASIGLQMTMTPRFVNAATDRILAALASSGDQIPGPDDVTAPSSMGCASATGEAAREKPPHSSGDHAEMARDDVDCDTCDGAGEVEARIGFGTDYVPCPECVSRENRIERDALIAEVAALRGERDEVAGESVWWKVVIGDGSHQPSGEVRSIKHMHPEMVKPIYDAHKGTAVADVIAGLVFSLAINQNREQFLVAHANDRATEAERKLAEAVAVISDIAETPYSGVDWPRSRAATYLASKEAERG